TKNKPYNDPPQADTVQRAAANFKPLLVNAHLHESALLDWTLRQTRGVNLVFDYQRNMTAEMLDHRFVSPGSPLLGPLKWLEGRIDRAADAVIASSHNAEKGLRTRTGDNSGRITTVLDAVNTQAFAPPATGMERAATAALKE